MKLKRCTRCLKNKPVAAFRRLGAAKGKYADSLRARCIDCEREVVREWQQNNPERYRELQQRYRDKKRKEST